MKRLIGVISLLLTGILLPFFSSAAQTQPDSLESLESKALKVYIDCDLCDLSDFDYIRTEITFVNYVRDRKEAQVHVLINLFRYAESTRRQLRFFYKAGYNFYRYEQETIFDKTTETLLDEVLSITLDVKQPWGSVRTSFEGSNYFHAFKKNRLELFGELSLRLFKGVSLQVVGEISRIRDQLSLPKGGASPEEILLQRRQLATQYSYFASIGLSYTFGSIYNNVVNPRFGN